jgi:predicted dehydrogenase
VLGVAVIGAGAISPAHIRAYLAFADRCKITVVCDLNEEKARQKIAEYNLAAEACADYRELLKREDIHLVSVCTPPYTHATITLDALRAGKHVIVEKPMASSLEECDAMIDAANRSGKVLSVIAQNRFTTPMMKLKAVLDSGLAGPVVHAQVDSFWWRGISYYDFVVAGHLGEGRRRMHIEPCGASHRHFPVDERAAGGNHGGHGQHEP